MVFSVTTKNRKHPQKLLHRKVYSKVIRKIYQVQYWLFHFTAKKEIVIWLQESSHVAKNEVCYLISNVMESDFQPQLQHISTGLQLQRHSFCCWVIGCHFIVELHKDFEFFWLYSKSLDIYRQKHFSVLSTQSLYNSIP